MAVARHERSHAMPPTSDDATQSSYALLQTIAYRYSPNLTPVRQQAIDHIVQQLLSTRSANEWLTLSDIYELASEVLGAYSLSSSGIEAALNRLHRSRHVQIRQRPRSLEYALTRAGR